MPKLQHNFTHGKMNKDLDERLVPNGQYRDALNIQISTSEGSDVGAVENILGTTLKSAGFTYTSPKTVGAIRFNAENKIYWFIASSTASAIAEYDEATDTIVPVLVDTQNILNFSQNNIITGINILEGFLMWTDNTSEPKKINIERFKSGTTSWTTHTQVYSRDFIESDITVIKKRPQIAPSFDAKSTRKTGTGIGCGINSVTATYNFTINPTGSASYPVPTNSIHTLTFTQENDWSIGDIILLTASKKNENNLIDEYQVRAEVVAIPSASPWDYDLKVLSISSDMLGIDLEWNCVLEEDQPMFKLKFFRLGYRWKYIDGEYSGFSPFSNVVFVPDSFEYKTSKAYNEGMINNLRYLRVHSFEAAPADVVEIDILYKEVNSTGVYAIDTVPVSTVDYEIDSEIIGGIVEPSQLLRAWDNVPRKALAQDIVGNRIVYGNYTQNYNIAKPSLSANAISVDHASIANPLASIKALRNYQIGVVYGDEYGRETPVFTSDNAGIIFSKSVAHKVNSIEATINSAAPSWASYFKYFIKDTSNEYYNIALDRFYKADDGNIWLAFPSAERNKLQVGDFIALKKIHDDDAPVVQDVEYKILDISNEAPKDVASKKVLRSFYKASITVTEGEKNFTFKGPLVEDNPDFFKAFYSGVYIRFKGADDYSDYYELEEGGPNGEKWSTTNMWYDIKLAEAVGTEITNIGAIEAIYVYHIESVQREEFQGKFFAKINRDTSFEDYVINPQFQYNPVYDKLFNSDVWDEITDTAGDGIVEPANYAWGENGYPNNNAPSEGSATMMISYAPFPKAKYDADDLTSGAAWFDSGIAEDVFIKFNSDPLGKYYKIASVSTAKAIRLDAATPPGNDDYILNKFITLTEVIEGDASAWTSYDFGVYKQSTDWDVLFDQFDKTLSSPNPAIFETKPLETAELDIYYEATDAIDISQHGNTIALDYFNCYSFGNGVESNRVRDDFNAPYIDKGTKASAVLKEQYGEEKRVNGLIYSGLFNTSSGFNQLNQFNMAEKITKDLNPEYGTIQKLHTRDTDLIALCEDKIVRILANKDALYNADGNINLTATNRVLGQAGTFAGEYGISKNPESFSSYGFRAYFTDKSRGAVIRLSADGITVVSDYSMVDYFNKKFKAATTIIGSYDEDEGCYNVSFSDETVSFKEEVGGWPSRKSFVPELALSLNSEYYSFKNGELWQHSNETRSNFYGVQYDSSITPIFNDAPSSIKNFKTLSYEGTPGWVASVITDQQDGEVVEWKTKEGIHFNYIKGLATTLSNMDTAEFSIQGLGFTSNIWPVGTTQDIEFPSINASLSIGDIIFKVDINGTTVECGPVAAINGNVVTFNVVSGAVGANEFVFFVKDSEINTSGIVGYHANVTFSTSSSEFKELFAVNSEVFISSE